MNNHQRDKIKGICRINPNLQAAVQRKISRFLSSDEISSTLILNRVSEKQIMYR